MPTPQEAYDYFVGIGYKPHQAAAIVGNMQAESRLNPTILGDKGTAYGSMQWRGSRQADLDTFARSQGLDKSDPKTQWDFYNWELQNTERGAGDRLRAATDVRSANDAVVSSLRPAGFKPGNAAGAMHYDVRLNNAQRLLGGGSPGSEATAVASGPPQPPMGLGSGLQAPQTQQQQRSAALGQQGMQMAQQAAGGKAAVPAAPDPGTSGGQPPQQQLVNPFRRATQQVARQPMPTIAGLLGGYNG
jgi:hypothetical protein